MGLQHFMLKLRHYLCSNFCSCSLDNLIMTLNVLRCNYDTVTIYALTFVTIIMTMLLWICSFLFCNYCALSFYAIGNYGTLLFIAITFIVEITTLKICKV